MHLQPCQSGLHDYLPLEGTFALVHMLSLLQKGGLSVERALRNVTVRISCPTTSGVL
jgi:hypothetical protein